MNENDFLYTLKEYIKLEKKYNILGLMEKCELSFNYTSVFASKSYQFRAYVDIRVPIFKIKELKNFQGELNKYCGELFVENEQYAFYGVDIKPLLIKEEIVEKDKEKNEFIEDLQNNKSILFKISSKTEEALAKIIVGDNKKYLYRKGYELVEFFNQFGFEDTYSVLNFTSRIHYTIGKVKRMNEIGNIDELMEVLFDPRDYFDNEHYLVESINYINKYLKFDGYILKRYLEIYKLDIYEGVRNDEVQVKSNTEEEKILKQEFANEKKEIKLFFSYSHKDEKLRDELEKHLSILKRKGVISTWHDRKIDAGSILDKEIDENLKDSNIILLLISADFLSSDYCYDIEMNEAVKMHENNQAVVVPVILRSCDWTFAPFSKLMALPTDGKSITTWSDIDSAFMNVAKGIRNIATKL